MKATRLLTAMILFTFYGHAQNFFYIENNNVTGKSIREELIKASQYVTQSPLASDYIITASASIETGTKILCLNIAMQDSISRETFFQAREEYTLNSGNANIRSCLKMMITGFIQKNISRLVVCAQEEHADTHFRYLKARKDKT
jgi:hypothetical protein